MSPPKSFTELLKLVDDDCENVPLVDSPAPPKTIGNSIWVVEGRGGWPKKRSEKSEKDSEGAKGYRAFEVRLSKISSQTSGKSGGLAILNTKLYFERMNEHMNNFLLTVWEYLALAKVMGTLFTICCDILDLDNSL